jgi:hypothetical protein
MMRRTGLALICLFALGACASVRGGAPGSDDIQQLETARVLQPFVSPARDERGFVEFGPTVETRNVVCAPRGVTFLCTYESRIKDFLGPFGAWEAHRETVQAGPKGRWRFVSGEQPS